MPAEHTQEIGRKGVALFKRTLESTTYFDLPFHAYANSSQCEVQYDSNGYKIFDLSGSLLTNPPKQVYVEGKNYSSSSNLHNQYLEMIAVAYGSIRYRLSQGRDDPEEQFIFITTHPFSTSKWSNLSSIESIEAAFNAHPDIVGNDTFDIKIAQKVEKRIWLIVTHPRQQEINLSGKEILKVWKKLNRKKGSL